VQKAQLCVAMDPYIFFASGFDCCWVPPCFWMTFRQLCVAKSARSPFTRTAEVYLLHAKLRSDTATLILHISTGYFAYDLFVMIYCNMHVGAPHLIPHHNALLIPYLLAISHSI
jgi:hypothetical protein